MEHAALGWLTKTVRNSQICTNCIIKSTLGTAVGHIFNKFAIPFLLLCEWSFNVLKFH